MSLRIDVLQNASKYDWQPVLIEAIVQRRFDAEKQRLIARADADASDGVQRSVIWRKADTDAGFEMQVIETESFSAYKDTGWKTVYKTTKVEKESSVFSFPVSYIHMEVDAIPHVMKMLFDDINYHAVEVQEETTGDDVIYHLTPVSDRARKVCALLRRRYEILRRK